MRNSAVLLLLLFASIQISEGQSLLQSFRRLSGPEKTWTIFHLFRAKKAWQITAVARSATQEVLRDSLLDQFPNGGKIDAFRHAYWMALEVNGIGEKSAVKLGKAHEKGNYRDFKKGRLEEGELPDSLSGEMDIYNNTVGISIGIASKTINKEELKSLVIKAITQGEMLIMKRDRRGIKISCNGEIVTTPANRKFWYLPYCLVRSDYSP